MQTRKPAVNLHHTLEEIAAMLAHHRALGRWRAGRMQPAAALPPTPATAERAGCGAGSAICIPDLASSKTCRPGREARLGGAQ
jgi:hypothetical protein